jgi:hypothetical protein
VQPAAVKPTTLLETVHVCDPVLFPNIRTILQLLLSLPVGSCSCERSFSALRRLKTFLRTTTSEERLNGLALAYIHRDIVVDLDRVLQKWDGSGHRRIHLAFSSIEKS